MGLLLSSERQGGALLLIGLYGALVGAGLLDVVEDLRPLLRGDGGVGGREHAVVEMAPGGFLLLQVEIRDAAFLGEPLQMRPTSAGSASGTAKAWRNSTPVTRESGSCVGLSVVVRCRRVWCLPHQGTGFRPPVFFQIRNSAACREGDEDQL